MRIAAIVCNVLLLAFTCVVLATEGAPRDPEYVVYTALVLLAPLLNVWALLRTSAGLRKAAVAANVLLIGCTIWALVDQYPHPEESGVVAYAILMLLTPVLTTVVLGRPGVRGGERVASR